RFSHGGPLAEQNATPCLQAKGIMKDQIPPGATAQAHRSTPPLFGFGLVDAIPEATILSHERRHGAKGDGIAGYANRTIDGRVGRFGRKAAVAALLDFNAGAFPQEMGVTTPLSPVEETVNGTPVPPDTDPAPDPEITVEDIEKVTAFTRFLAPPPQQLFTNHTDLHLARRGRKLFAHLNCAVCHMPKMNTGPSTSKALNRKTVALYSDLMVHDMGSALADICLEQAHPSEFRTEMITVLWTMAVAGSLAAATQASEVEQLKSDLIGQCMGGREKCWKFQSVDQIKALTIQKKTEDSQKRVYTIALQLQAAKAAGK